MFKVTNKDTRTTSNFEHISHLVLVFLVNFVQVNAGGVEYLRTDAATKVPKFIQLQGKLKFLQSVSTEKKSSDF